MGDRLQASPGAVTMARMLAARVAAGGHQVVFPAGSDPATFKVAGLPGGPDVEVSAQENGRVCCHYTGRSQAAAAVVIARLPVPGHPDVQALTGDTLTATWSGIEIEWEHLPPGGQPADPGLAAAALLAHLAVLAGHDDGEDAPR
jgi:hypothetical protein